MMGNYAATHTVVLEAVGLADYEATVQKRRSVSSQWIMGSSLECEQNISATFSSWRSKAASEFRLERSERSFNKYIASVYFNNTPRPLQVGQMSFPLSLQTWHTSSREMSLRSLPVASQAGPVTLPVPLQLGRSMYSYLGRQGLRTIWERERSIMDRLARTLSFL